MLRLDFRWILLGTAVMLCGCGPETMPKGTGASGLVTQASAGADDLGLSIINRLTPDQEQSLRWLHRGFDESASVQDGLTEEATQKLNKIKEHWSSVRYANPDPNAGVNGEKTLYLAMLVTDVGNLEFQFISDYAPDHVRSFVSMAQLGMLDGLTLNVDGGLLWLGSPDEKPLFELESAYYATGVRPGLLLAPVTRDGMTAGTKFAITLTDDASVRGKATVFGGTIPTLGTESASIAEILAKCNENPGSVKIKEVKVAGRTIRLFDEAGLANLPRLDESGRPRTTPDGIPQDVADKMAEQEQEQ